MDVEMTFATDLCNFCWIQFYLCCIVWRIGLLYHVAPSTELVVDGEHIRLYQVLEQIGIVTSVRCLRWPLWLAIIFFLGADLQLQVLRVSNHWCLVSIELGGWALLVYLSFLIIRTLFILFQFEERCSWTIILLSCVELVDRWKNTKAFLVGLDEPVQALLLVLIEVYFSAYYVQIE